MPLHDAHSLLIVLSDHGLLPKAPLNEVRPLAGQFPKAADLARELVRRGLLTKYQANEINQGRAAGLVLGPYLLLEPLRKGGMGEVFKGRHRDLDRLVALKFIRVEYADRPDTIERFRRECLAAARLSHPNIVLVYDAHLDGDLRYLAMEYIDGMDLGSAVKERGALPTAEACEYARQAALGLQHAHERGLVHRDVKPANLMRTADGATVKVLDLGLARLRGAAGSADADAGLTQQGAVMGTPDYLAPEQAGGDSAEADARTDVYGLGCTLYHLLSGRPPFSGRTIGEKIAAHLSQAAPLLSECRAGLPIGLAAMVRRMMAKKPAERYQTAGEAAAALAPFCRQGPAAGTVSLPTAEPTPIGGTLPQIATPAVHVSGPLPPGSTLPQTPSGLRPSKPLAPPRPPRWLLAAVAAAGVLLACPCMGFLGWRMFSPPARNGPGVAPVAQADGATPPATEKDKDKGPAHDPGANPAVAPRIDLPPPPKHVAVRDGLAWPPAECVALLGDDSGRHWGEVQAVAFRPDGQVIATSDHVAGQAYIHIWDAATLRERAAWTPAGVVVLEMAFSPDGKRLAAVCGDGLRLWDAADDGLSHERKFGAPGAGPGSNLFHLVFTIDGASLLAWDATSAVRKWRLTNGDPKEDGDPIPAPPRFLALAVSADGKTEAYSSGNALTGKNQIAVRTLSEKSGEERSVELSAAAGALAISADGKRLAARVGSPISAGELRVWDLDGKEIRPRKTIELSRNELYDFLPCFTFTPDGERIALATGPRVGAPAIFLFDATTGAETRLDGLDSPATCLSFPADGKALAAGGRDHRLRLWDDHGGKWAARPCGPAAAGVVRRLAFRPNGDDLAAVSRLNEKVDGNADASNLIVWDLKKGKAREVIPCDGWFSDCAYTPDGARLFVGGMTPGKGGVGAPYRGGVLRCWRADALTEEALKLPRPMQAGPIDVVAFDHDGKTLALLGGDDFSRKACVCGVDPFGVRGEPFDVGQLMESLALAPDGATAAVLGSRGQGFGEVPLVKLWDLKNVDSGPPKEVAPANPLEGAQSQKGRRLTFAPNGKTLAALVQMGSFPDDPRRALLWDVATGRTRAVGDATGKQPAHVEALAFSPDSGTLATADADGRVALWRLETLEEIGEWRFPGPVHSLAFDATGGFLATGDADGTIAVLRLPAPAPPAPGGKKNPGGGA